MTDPAEIIHLLRRTEFVARPARVAELTAVTFAEAVDRVLGHAAPPVPIPPEIAFHSEVNNDQQYVFATHWWLERMTRSATTPMRERMALFWHGHFCSDWSKVSQTAAMMGQNALFRDLGLSNLVDLVRAVSTQPAMLAYLDNVSNRRQSPNQNFSRELLELFLLGVGNYTEADVEAATLAWTGYSADRDTGEFLFRASWHDGGVKTFLGRTGNWTGDDVIDIVFGTDAIVAVGPNAGIPTRVVAARFLTRKLWESFVHQGPPAEAVHDLADVLVSSDFEIRPWVAAMLLRPEFRSTAARQGLVRTPTEYIVALLHATGLSAATVNPEWFALRMGQALFRPPNVSGWRPNGYWVNASAMAARAEFAQHVRWTLNAADELVLGSNSYPWADLDAMTPAVLIDTLADDVGVALAPATRATLVSWAESEQRPWGPDWWRSRNAVLLTMLVPEMNVA
ncbi:DUF1800 domain-containing protein [soil metagenome]